MRLADRGGCLASANTAAPSLTPPRPYGVKFIRCASLRSTHPTRPALEANTRRYPLHLGNCTACGEPPAKPPLDSEQIVSVTEIIEELAAVLQWGHFARHRTYLR